MSSRKPRTQRKALYEMELHRRHSLVNAHVSKELGAKLGTKARSVQLRKGDRVRIMRGAHKGKSGKVTGVDLKNTVAFIEGIVVRKAKGGEVPLPFHPSNLMITEGNFEDKGRKKVLERKKRS